MGHSLLQATKNTGISKIVMLYSAQLQGLIEQSTFMLPESIRTILEKLRRHTGEMSPTEIQPRGIRRTSVVIQKNY